MTVMNTKNLFFKFLLGFCFIFYSLGAKAELMDQLKNLQAAYPDHIKSVSKDYIIWNDGTKMPIGNSQPNKSMQEKLSNPSLADQIEDDNYSLDRPIPAVIMQTKSDPGRIRYEPFFAKMYGENKSEVIKNLVTIYWMPKIFGKKYAFDVTKVNDIDKKLQHISDELEKLPSGYFIYLDHPGGTFEWRNIAGTNQFSVHKYGIAIDINPKLADYWAWDLKHTGRPVSEDANLTYRNRIPWQIVEIFEKNGFIWGGKWYHYDTMHFEYRPELIRHEKQ